MDKDLTKDRAFGLSDRDLKTCRSILNNYPEVLTVFIFGSRAKGVGHLGSDIDLAVMNPLRETATFRKIKADFEASSLPYTVDLVDYTRCDHKDLKDHIDRVGRLFYQRSRN